VASHQGACGAADGAASSAATGAAASAASHAACIHAARESYGRLLALLAARSHDIAASEDALADAFAAALDAWPRDGVPDRPEAWLFTVARRRLHDQWRHAGVRDGAAQTLALLADEAVFDEDAASAVPDERLRLLFVCAHPAIPVAARAPLMLQTVLGLDVARMAGAFLTSPGTLGQRLVRAKARIRAAGVPFEYPQAHELPQRLADVMEGIYAAYGTGWDEVQGADPTRQGLTQEAIGLGRILCALLPDEPEPLGLLALMLLCESRSRARRNADGAYVPLDRQDSSAWQQPLWEEAEHCLARAVQRGAPGPLQLEAAIQSAHTQRGLGADVPGEAIVALYDALITLRPGIGAEVGRACALGAARGAGAALQALAAMDAATASVYQPWWAARAHWLAQAGHGTEARAAYNRAMGLTAHPAVREFLARQMLGLPGPG
jgi:RNA polymerase sigma-70 factor (ECF subfamily)